MSLTIRPLRSGEDALLSWATLTTMNWCGPRFTEHDVESRPEFSHYTRLDPARGDFGFVAEDAGPSGADGAAAEGVPGDRGDGSNALRGKNDAPAGGRSLSMYRAVRRVPTPIGVVWLVHLPSTDRGYGFVAPGIPELSLAVLDPQARGQGVGSRLLREAISEAKRRELRAISLSVEAPNPAERLYRRLGFVDAKGAADGTLILEL